MEYTPPEMTQKALVKGQGELPQEEFKTAKALLESEFQSRYTIGPLILRRGESYFFSAGTEEEVQVGATTLTSGEELELKNWHTDLGSGRTLLTMEALEQDSTVVTIEPATLTTRGVIGGRHVQVSVTVLPIIYGRVMTSYKSQGREYPNIYVHAAGQQGEDNQLLTMISRGMGNPWAGTLRIDGIRMALRGAEQIDLIKKMRSHPKSLLVAKLLGKDVDPQAISRGQHVDTHSRSARAGDLVDKGDGK